MKNQTSKPFLGDQDLQLIVGKILRWGVFIASLTVFIGGMVYLMHHGNELTPDYRNFIGEANSNTTVSGIIQGALQWKAPQMIQLGVVFLIATPILRVFFSLIGFTLEKDKMYIIITLIVLSIIIGSILSGVKG